MATNLEKITRNFNRNPESNCLALQTGRMRENSFAPSERATFSAQPFIPNTQKTTDGMHSTSLEWSRNSIAPEVLLIAGFAHLFVLVSSRLTVEILSHSAVQLNCLQVIWFGVNSFFIHANSSPLGSLQLAYLINFVGTALCAK